LIVSLAIFIFSWILVVFIPLGQWLNLSIITGKDLNIIIFLMVICVQVSFYIGLFLAAYRCEGKYHRGLIFVNLFVVIDFMATAIFLVLGFGPVSVMEAMIGARIISLVGMYIDLRRISPWLNFGFSKASYQEIRRMFLPSLSFMSYPLSSAISNQGLISIVGIMLNPKTVVLVSTMKTLINTVIRLFDMVNQSFYPEMSMAFGSGNKALLKRLHRSSCQAAIWIGAGSIIFLFLGGRWIFNIWTGGKISFDPLLLDMFLLITLVHSVWYTSLVLPSSINRHQRIALAYLIFSLISISAFAMMLKVMGFYWSLLALIGLEFIMITQVLPISLKLSGDNISGFIRQVVKPPNPLAVVRILIKKKKLAEAH
jgi:O-antigen/teichoic acid export membrane protein